MAGTFTFLGTHFVFSTKNRIPRIFNDINDRLCSYIGGIIKELGGILIEIHAMPEHIHFYAYMPKTVSVLKFIGILNKYGIEYDEKYIWK